VGQGGVEPPTSRLSAGRVETVPLKERRRLATRFEKLALHHLAIVKLAMAEKYLRLTLPDTR
jgi:hypothetical protein